MSLIIPSWLFFEPSFDDSSLIIVGNFDCIIDRDHDSINDNTFPLITGNRPKKTAPPRPVRPVEYITVSNSSMLICN